MSLFLSNSAMCRVCSGHVRNMSGICLGVLGACLEHGPWPAWDVFGEQMLRRWSVFLGMLGKDSGYLRVAGVFGACLGQGISLRRAAAFVPASCDMVFPMLELVSVKKFSCLHETVDA